MISFKSVVVDVEIIETVLVNRSTVLNTDMPKTK